MNRFLVFSYEPGDASGGWNDFSSAHAELDDAVSACDKLHEPDAWGRKAHVVDVATLRVVYPASKVDPATCHWCNKLVTPVMTPTHGLKYADDKGSSYCPQNPDRPCSHEVK